MLIKLTAVVDDMLGSHKAKRIEGIKLDNNEEWSKKIFANAKELREQLDDFGIGDIVNVKQTKSGKFWNVTAFETPSDSLIDSVKSGGGYKPTPSTGGGSSTKKSTWGGRTGEAYDRSAAIYLAVDILKTNKTAKGQVDIKQAVIDAETIFDYIHSGTNPFLDPLEPPVDDDEVE